MRMVLSYRHNGLPDSCWTEWTVKVIAGMGICLCVGLSGCMPTPRTTPEIVKTPVVTPVSSSANDHPYGLMDIQGKHGKGEWRHDQPLR